jgi:hypothetical protein
VNDANMKVEVNTNTPNAKVDAGDLPRDRRAERRAGEGKL